MNGTLLQDKKELPKVMFYPISLMKYSLIALGKNQFAILHPSMFSIDRNKEDGVIRISGHRSLLEERLPTPLGHALEDKIRNIHMIDTNKAILERANAAITAGDNEGFLSFCTNETEWTFVGDKRLQGKQAVRVWMATAYIEPPKFLVENLIAGGDFVTALGKISLKHQDEKTSDYSYCDVWRFRDGKMAQLQALLIKTESKGA